MPHGGLIQFLLDKMDNGNFYSIDRLVEFGMGMAMAQQMIRVMNETMQTMYVPGSPNNLPIPQVFTIYVGIDGKPIGPLNESEFTKMVSEKKVTCSTLVWMPGMTGWKPIDQVPAALRIIALVPPPIPINL